MPKPRGYADPSLRRVTFNITLDGRMYDVLARLAAKRNISVREYIMDVMTIHAMERKRDVPMPPEHYTARHGEEIIVE